PRMRRRQPVLVLTCQERAGPYEQEGRSDCGRDELHSVSVSGVDECRKPSTQVGWAARSTFALPDPLDDVLWRAFHAAKRAEKIAQTRMLLDQTAPTLSRQLG